MSVGSPRRRSPVTGSAATSAAGIEETRGSTAVNWAPWRPAMSTRGSTRGSTWARPSGSSGRGGQARRSCSTARSASGAPTTGRSSPPGAASTGCRRGDAAGSGSGGEQRMLGMARVPVLWQRLPVADDVGGSRPGARRLRRQDGRHGGMGHRTRAGCRGHPPVGGPGSGAQARLKGGTPESIPLNSSPLAAASSAGVHMESRWIWPVV